MSTSGLPLHDAASDESADLQIKKNRNNAVEIHQAHDGDDSDLEQGISLQASGSDSAQQHAQVDGGVVRKVPTLQDQTNLLPFKQLIVVFVGLSCALFCSLLDQTIVSTALPTLGRVFGQASIESWVGTAYLLTSTACQPMYGRLSDIFGRKAMLLSCMAIFLLGSVLCAVSQSMIMLIVCRAVSGIGGGGILTSCMIVISDVVSLKERGKYQGILGGVVALANSLGPLLGGIFTEKVSWRWCFYINIPLTSFAILVVALVLPLKKVKGNYKSKLMKVDYTGCAVMFGATTLILIPLSWGGTAYAWDSAGVLAPLLIGVALLGGFFIVETKLAILPLIPMYIFKNSTVFGSCVSSFLTGIMFYANLYYLPQFYQVVRLASPIHSGILLFPLILTQTVTSFTSGYIVSRTGNYVVLLYTGFAIWAIACGLLSTISPTISTAKLSGYQILSGIGSGQTLQTSLIAIQANVERKDMAVATGVRNFVRILGGTVGLAACTAILNNTAKKALSTTLSAAQVQTIISDPTRITSAILGLTKEQQHTALIAYTHGIRNIYYFMIPCCVLSLLLTVLFVKQRSLVRADDEARKAEGKAWVAGRRDKGKDAAVAMEGGTQAAPDAASAPVEAQVVPVQREEEVVSKT